MQAIGGAVTLKQKIHAKIHARRASGAPAAPHTLSSFSAAMLLAALTLLLAVVLGLLLRARGRMPGYDLKGWVTRRGASWLVVVVVLTDSALLCCPTLLVSLSDCTR